MLTPKDSPIIAARRETLRWSASIGGNLKFNHSPVSEFFPISTKD